MKHRGGRPRKVRWADVRYAQDLHDLGRSWEMIADLLGYPAGALKAAASRLARGHVGYPIEFRTAQEGAEPTGPSPNASEAA